MTETLLFKSMSSFVFVWVLFFFVLPISSRLRLATLICPGKNMLPYPSLPTVKPSTKQSPFSSTSSQSSSTEGIVQYPGRVRTIPAKLGGGGVVYQKKSLSIKVHVRRHFQLKNMHAHIFLLVQNKQLKLNCLCSINLNSEITYRSLDAFIYCLIQTEIRVIRRFRCYRNSFMNIQLRYCVVKVF